MAKKGGQQQLQADISTDEDFEKFLERPGLLVLDVYSEWCGPCLGMVGSLRKIKLEIGGDNLHLAICKADTITCLKRFCKKSEPTWLFVTGGKTVNLMFGTNVPKLMKMITQELNLLSSKTPRQVYNLTEPLPEEVERIRKKEFAIAEAARIELAEKTKKRRDYLNYVTDTIMENLTDIGITMFGPQVNRDMYKKITEPADAHKIQCKDRRVVTVSKDDFEVINYACRNPLDPDIIEQLHGKELLLCFWKVPDGTNLSISEILQMYANDLTKTETTKGDDGEEITTQPILSPMKVKIEVELQEGEEWEEEEEPEISEPRSSKMPAKTEDGIEGEEAEGEREEEEEGEGGEVAEEQKMPEMPPLDMGLDLNDDEEEEEEGQEELVEEAPKKRTRTKTIILPPVWVPNNNRTHAALIYVYFRTQTTEFLPPDPVPEPPHVIMAFDAYKKRDLISLAERNKDDVLLYGFFTSDDVEEAQYIASSDQVYAKSPHTASDKIVFKVAKQTSNTMLSMATYGPSYVSPNTVIGKEEAIKFFPPNYKTAAEERAEALKEEQEAPKKAKKKAEEEAAKAAAPARVAEPAPAPAPAPADESAAPVDEARPEGVEGEGEVPPPPPAAEGEGGEAGEEAPAAAVPAEATPEAAAGAPEAGAEAPAEAPPPPPPPAEEPAAEAPAEPAPTETPAAPPAE